MSSSALGRLLIVDDEPELLSALSEIVREQGYEVGTFSSGKAALESLKEHSYDALLSDLMMPEIDGITLLRSALEVDPHLMVVLMTGQGTVQTAVEAMKLGAFDYLLKPFKTATLLPTLERAMAVRRLRLENLQLRETLAIYELCQAIAFSLDSNLILNKLADAALQQTQADELSILLPTADGKEMYIAAVRGPRAQSLAGQRVPIDRGIAGWVASHREPLLLHGRVDDPRFAPLLARPEIRSAICQPIMAGGRLVGVLNVNQLRPGRPFTLGQMKAISILAGTGAAALESSNLIAQLRQGEERTHQIIEHANDAFVAIDAGGRILEWNRQAELTFGWPRGEVQGRLLQETIIPPEHREAHRQGLQRFLATGEGPLLNKHVEITALHRDGHAFPVELQITPIAWGGSFIFTAFVRDITERRRLEEQYRQAQKMEAVGRLAGGIAHDFNNLLTVINGYSELLLGKVHAQDPMRGLIDQINKSGNRAASLTRQLLAFSRKQMLVPDVLDLNAVVGEMEKMVRRLIGEDIDLFFRPDPKLWKVKADPGQIEQVIMNLVVNARDAMPMGGKLTIETRNVELDEQYAKTHPDARPGQYALLAVSDTGSGMDQATLARIFEPFFTTKGPEKGTGLGLATVYGIVKQSEGSIEVYSELNRGTTFKVYLPRCEASSPLRKSYAATGGPVRGSETILLVEDDAGVRMLTRMVLQDHGYAVLEAANPGEAFLLCEQHQGTIHLLVTDVVMPNMSGPQAAERLTQMRPGIKVLYLSGYTDEAVVRHGVISADTPFLQKPFKPDALAAKVREVLEARN